MPSLKALYTDGDLDTFEVITSAVVETVTHSELAHAAIIVDILGDEYIFEAIAPHVCLSSGDKYDKARVKKIIEIPITDEQHLLIQRYILHRVAKKPLYGLFTDCIAGGIADIFGDKAGEEVASFICGDTSGDCSREQADVIRLVLSDFMKGVSDHIITPIDSYLALCSLMGITPEIE